MPVLNKHKDVLPKDAVYIGRGSKWGNPFVIGKHGDRNAVCDQHKQYLWKQIQSGEVTLDELASLHNKSLIYFCAPLRCHGDTLLQAAAWAVNQLQTKQEI